MKERKKKLKIFILVLIFILTVVFCRHIVKNKLNENRIIGLDGYLFYNIDRSKFNIDKIEEYTYDASTVLEETLTGFYKWDQLPLTQHFKDKFKYNRKNIIKDICDLEHLYNYTYEKEGEKLLEITGDRADNILTNIILPSIATVYTFKYEVVDGKLDDVELVEKYNMDATTGKKLFAKDAPLKFES